MADSGSRTAGLADVAAEFESATLESHALDKSTLDLQLQIARVPAPTGDEDARARLVASLLDARSLFVTTDDFGNVIGCDRTSASPIAPVVCMAHLDTVFGAETPLTVRLDGPRICCPGIGDNSRGLAAMLALATMHTRRQTAYLSGESNVGVTQSDDTGSQHAFSSEPRPARPVEFVATVGEEGLGNLRGSRGYFDNRAKRGLPEPHAVLVLDGPGDGNVVHHALGSRRYRITFDGPGGHSWVDFGAPNAVHAAARCAAWISELPRTMNNRVAVTVSGIGGGESVNSIPMHAWLEVDVRARDASVLRRVDAELRMMIRAATEQEQNNSARVRAADTAIAASIRMIGDRPAGSIDVQHPLVMLANRVTRYFNIEPVSAIASTDANIPLSRGIPAITIGGGGTGGASHTTNEWYDNTHGSRGVARAFAILRALTVSQAMPMQ